jgi:hypothetical protein
MGTILRLQAEGLEEMRGRITKFCAFVLVITTPPLSNVGHLATIGDL